MQNYRNLNVNKKSCTTNCFMLSIYLFFGGMWVGKAMTEYIIKQKIRTNFDYNLSDIEAGLQCINEERKYVESIKGDK